MTNLQKLRQAIIKEIPEIVELKFGCKVEVKWQGEKKKRGFVFRNFLIGELDIICNFNEIYSVNPKNKKTPQIVKIIGRDIKLADVLRVVWIVQPTMEITDKDRVDFGAMVNVTEERVFDVVQDWSLSKNNLDLQSKGTIDFLTEIICNKDE